MKVSVQQGQCRINGYVLLVDTDTVKILLFDTKDKYPTFQVTGEYSVFIGLDEGSLSYKERKDSPYSEVIVEGLDGWDMITGEAGRYSFHLIFYKEPNPNCVKGNFFDTISVP